MLTQQTKAIITLWKPFSFSLAVKIGETEQC